MIHPLDAVQRELSDIWLCYQHRELSEDAIQLVDSLLTDLWSSCGRPPRKGADLAAWETFYGDSVGAPDSFSELQRDISEASQAIETSDPLARLFNGIGFAGMVTQRRRLNRAAWADERRQKEIDNTWNATRW